MIKIAKKLKLQLNKKRENIMLEQRVDEINKYIEYNLTTFKQNVKIVST